MLHHKYEHVRTHDRAGFPVDAVRWDGPRGNAADGRGHTGTGKQTMKSKSRYPLALLALVAAPCVKAADSNLEASGFSGQLSLGPILVSAKTNMVSSAGLGLLKLGEGVPESLNGQPMVHTGLLPAVTLSLRYTFPETGTQLFAGGTGGDPLQFEYFLQGGVRQAIGSAGALSLAYLYGLPVKAWADPYVTGVGRTETNRGSQGARLGWERIFGSGLQAQYTFRHATVDREDSGSLLGLTPEDARLLRRTGDIHQGEIRYAFTFARAHQLTPALVYTREDFQGKAMSAQGYEFKLRYALRAGVIGAVVEGAIGRSLHDERNPVFGRTEADTRYTASATLLYRRPFGWEPFGYKRWSLLANVGYTAAHSDIAFYSASVFATGLGFSMEF